MKHDPASPGAPGADRALAPSSEPPTSTRAETADLVAAEAPAGSVRILLGLDVPAGALPEIEADWARIGEATRVAPDLVPAMIAVALGRLQRLALGVSGVAVAERRGNPFARWVRSAA